MRRTIFITIILLMANALIEREGARAEIRAEIRGDRVVYTSRPSRNPATVESPPTRGARPLARAPAALSSLVVEASRKHGIDPDLVATVIRVESAFDTMAVSPKGARGLMQLMPDTARHFGARDPHDPEQNIAAGVAYLKELSENYRGDMTLALAAYNAGPSAVERAKGVPPFRETRDYIHRIESHYGPLPRASSASPIDPRIVKRGDIRPTRDDDGSVLWTNRRGRR